MFKRLFLFIALCFLLCGCGSKFSGQTYAINVPNTNSTYLEIQWPVELGLRYTDNATYWEFDDDSILYTSDHPEVKYDKDKETFIIGSKPDERHIIYTGTALSKSDFSNIIESATICNNVMSYDEDSGIKSIPDFSRKEIVLDKNGMAMPAEFINNIKDTANYYSASLLLDSKDVYMTAFILDRDVETAKQEIYNMVCVGTPLDYWYYSKDSGILMLRSNYKVAVAKAIRSNEWYVYLGTIDYLDYMLSGSELVTYAD